MPTPDDATAEVVIPRQKETVYLDHADNPKFDLVQTPEAKEAIRTILSRYLPSKPGFFVVTSSHHQHVERGGKKSSRKFILVMLMEIPDGQDGPAEGHHS